MYKFDLKNNPDLALARKRFQNRAYYARNRVRVLAAHKQWREQNPGYDAQFMRDKREISKGGNNENIRNIGHNRICNCICGKYHQRAHNTTRQ